MGEPIQEVNTCAIEKLANKKTGPYMFVIGMKLATITALCEDCPMVDICGPEFWRQKNAVRIRSGHSEID
jgi:hypothetical protein